MQARLEPGASVRPLAHRHLSGLLAVQRACYGSAYLESAEVFAARLASPAQCSLVLTQGGRVCAYLAAFDSAHGRLTPLHGAFEPVARPDTLYLHDLAVLPGLSGQGLGRALLEAAWRSALGRGLAQSALVAVPGAQGFWERRGYAVHALGDADQRERLAGYGEGARYMLRRLAGASGPPASSG